MVSTRPTKPGDWEEVATALNAAFSTPQKEVRLKGRGCRERMELLVKKYKEEDARALKRLDCCCFCKSQFWPFCVCMCMSV